MTLLAVYSLKSEHSMQMYLPLENKYSSSLSEITFLHFAHLVGLNLGGFGNFSKLYSLVP
jgi:hypothetical protein